MRLAVFGCGYVGLVTGVCFANLGFFVHCVDVDRQRIRRIKSGEVPFLEPGLADALKLAQSKQQFTADSDAATAVAEADVIFIAVGTPMNSDGSADLRHIETVASQIARSLRPG